MIKVQIMQMCEYNIHFRRLLYEDRILDMVEDLIGSRAELASNSSTTRRSSNRPTTAAPSTGTRTTPIGAAPRPTW